MWAACRLEIQRFERSRVGCSFVNSASKRRLRTVTWGAIPVLVLAAAVSLDHVPGTDISLTVPYAAEGPGPTVDTLGEVEGVQVVDVESTEGKTEVEQPKGQLNMTTVSVRTNMSLAQVIARWASTEDTIVPVEQIIPQDMTQEEVTEANEAQFTQSESAATVAAMDYLGKPVEIVVAKVMDDAAAAGALEAGDILTSVDGQAVSKPEEAQKLIQAKAPGDEVKLGFKRAADESAQPDDKADAAKGAKEQTATVTLGENPNDKKQALLGILMSSQPVTDVEVTYNLQDIGGPSAGMMFSLAVIDKLSPGDLTGDHFVAGTGTIAEDGTVGPIGGIVHKVRAARDAGAELFLAPSSNCAEAMSRDTGDMVVASVDTIADAVVAMDAFAHGGEVKTCQP